MSRAVRNLAARQQKRKTEPRYTDDLLPTCDGPKMHPFRDQDPNIEFECLLSQHSDESGYGGSQGYVLQATINSKTFAVKLVSRASFSYYSSAVCFR